MKRLLPKYQGQPGKNQGYYPSYTATSNNYNLLSQDYANSDEQGLLTTDQFTAGLFDKELSTYKSMSADTAPTVISNVTATDLNLSPGNADNAAIVKQALDNGHLVLVAVILFDANVPAGKPNTKDTATTTGTEYYSYNPETGVLTQNATAEVTNTWVHPTGCVLGGHGIWLVSYATDELGNTMFFVRNSWGDSGDQGQYYMSDTYLNNAILSGFSLMATK